MVVFDQSEPIAELSAPGVEVVANTRTPGAAGARNTGVLCASTELVAFCDDTDLWLPGKLKTQVDLMRTDPETEFVCCGVRLFSDSMSQDRCFPARLVHERDLLHGHIPQLHPSGFVVRRSAMVDGFGLFSEEIPGSYGEDYELLLRAAASTPIRNVPGAGVAVRWHEQSYFSAAEASDVIAAAGQWLLRRYPAMSRAGYAHWAGKVAMAEAIGGRRGSAARWAWRTLLRRPGDPRATLALAMAAGVPQTLVLAVLHRMGRGL